MPPAVNGFVGDDLLAFEVILKTFLVSQVDLTGGSTLHSRAVS